MRRRPVSFAIAVLFSAVLASTVSTLSIALSQASLVFLRFAEHRVGETDVIALPGETLPDTNGDYVVRSPIIFANLSSTSALNGINVTRIRDALGSSPRELCTSCKIPNPAPRWVASGYVTSTEGSKKEPSAKSYLLAFDTDVEKASGIGRFWHRRRGGKLEGYMSSSVR